MSEEKKGKLFLGTSGFYYGHWVGKFYPEELPRSQWLTFYSKNFSSIEINSSFYHLPKEKTLLSWYKKTSEGFKFSLKASKVITHTKKLRNTEDEVKKFIGLATLLKEKLGVILFQLPGSLKYDYKLLEEFLRFLPQDNTKYTIEFRDSSWFREDIFALLKKYEVALCNVSSPKIRELFEVTSSFLYIRFHGLNSWYRHNYTKDELLPWAKFVKNHMESGRDVYVYFNNDASGFAIQNAELLKTLIEEV